MKSICGYWALDAAPTPEATLSAMRNARLRADTPNFQEWRNLSGTLAFGSAWWSPQPGLSPPACIATHPASGCVAVADARLDNPAELRTALNLPAPDDAPDAITDHAATLILHAWLRWGEDCVNHIDGDFAFAVHDPRHNALYLARDRMGVRPLYIHHVPGRLLVFGSTSQTVLTHPQVPKELDEARIADYLLDCIGGALEGVDFTSTFYRAVQRHPPRNVLLIQPKQHRLRSYWQLEADCGRSLPKGNDEWAEALTYVLEQAVAQHLRGPERVGSMLSGGMDSTSLAIVAGEQLQAVGMPPLPTYSLIDSELTNCQETRAVRHLQEMPIFQHNIIDLADPATVEALLRFPESCQEPFDAFMPMIDAAYQSAAAGGVGAVIDGIDGDTLFRAGNAIPRQFRKGHWGLALANTRGMSRLYGGSSFRHYVLPNLGRALLPNALRRWLQSRHTSSRLSLLLEHSLIDGDFAKRTMLRERLERLAALRSPVLSPDPAQETADALMHTFPTAGLERYHRVAMGHGITPLHPFTNRQLLELAVNLPDQQRLRDGHFKPILRHAMRSRMPEPVRMRCDKQNLGFRLSRHLWAQRCAGTELPLDFWKPGLSQFIDTAKLSALATRHEGDLRGSCAPPTMIQAMILNAWLR